MLFNGRFLWSKPKQTDSAKLSPSQLLKRFYSPHPNDASEPSSCEELSRLNSELSLKLFQKLTTLCLQTGITIAPNQPALLARKFHNESPSIKTAISSLLPEYIAPLWTEVNGNESTHAEALETLIDATQCTLNITDVDSFKDHDTDRCTVSFRHGEEPIQWTFVEPNDHLSANFTRAATLFIGKCANGKFHRLYVDNGYHYYIFIPNKLSNVLLSSKKVVVNTV